MWWVVLGRAEEQPQGVAVRRRACAYLLARSIDRLINRRLHPCPALGMQQPGVQYGRCIQQPCMQALGAQARDFPMAPRAQCKQRHNSDHHAYANILIRVYTSCNARAPMRLGMSLAAAAVAGP